MFPRTVLTETPISHSMQQDFVPIIDSNGEKVIHIGKLCLCFLVAARLKHFPDYPPKYKATPKGLILTASSTHAPSLSEDSLAASGRERIPPPRAAHNFLPDLIAEDDKDFKLRDDIKPLHVIQPEGVSFKVNGHELEWQNWKMHIC